MRLPALVDIIGENSGEHTFTTGEDCQGEWHRRTLINTQSLSSGSLHVRVGHFSRWGRLVQMVSSKRGRGWSVNVLTGGCLMVFAGQHWVFLDAYKTALTRSQCWFPPPAKWVRGGHQQRLGCIWGFAAWGFPVVSKYEGSLLGWIH